MALHHGRSAVVGLLLAFGAAWVVLPLARAGDDGEVVAVSSKVSTDYVRVKLPDGSFRVETYAFGEGGRWNGTQRDDTIDRLRFLDVARTIAGPLANRSYLPAKDPRQVQLLIMVYWGTTSGAGGASGSIAYQRLSSINRQMPSLNPPPPATRSGQVANSGSADRMNSVLQKEADSAFDSALALALMENRQRDRVDRQNAAMLGFDDELAAADGRQFTALRWLRQDLVDDLEDDRYFVVLMAYDFQLLRNEKKHKLVWETRFSIRERRHDFGQELAAMAEYASRYFGEDTHGLLRQPIREGNVKIGELKNLGVVPGK